MKIKGISESRLRGTVRDISDSNYNGNIVFKREPEWIGNFLFFTLTVKTSFEAGARRSARGRRIAAACWHANRDIMAELFSANPDALLVTALARYEGREGFESIYPATGEKNIGSHYEPMAYADACECEA